MANKRISSLTALGGTPDDTDIIPITDVSDTTGSAQGTTKKVTVANLMSAGIFSDIVAETTTARTLSDSDCGKVINCSNASAVTITIPSTVSAGFNCTVVQSGAGQVTIAAGASVNLYCYSSTKATAGQYAAINIIPYATNSYVLEGDLASSGGGGGGGGGLSNTYSVDFDGTDDYVDISGASSSLNGLSAFSVSLWYNTSVSNGGLIAGGASTNNAFWLTRYSSSLLYFNVRNGGATYISAGATNADNVWHHIVGVANGANSKLYLNGSVVGSGTLPSLSSTGANNLAIGYIPPLSGVYCSGLIDEVAIFNSALSASDITSIYNSGTPDDLTSYSPVGWWRMGDNDGGTGTTITDQGSGGNDGTLTNGPTFSTTVP